MSLSQVTTLHHHVNMTDVDLVQINFARYLPWADQGFGAWLREAGHPLTTIIVNGFATPVVSVRCDYMRPLALDDAFWTRSAVTKVGRTSFVMTHRFEDENGLLALVRATHVWIRTQSTQTPEVAPQWLHDAVAAGFTDDVSEHLQ
jgi:YbgC/YbaW family acyl-CoA thioester hydrolase